MRNKLKTIYVLLLSIFLYFALTYVYNNYINHKSNNAIYILNKSVKRGDEITEAIVEKIRIDEKINDEYLSNIPNSDNKLVIDNDYCKGQVLYKSMTKEKKNYIAAEDNKEIMSLKLENSENAVSYEIEKGNIVNVFYTGRSSQAKDILNNLNKSMVMSSSNTESFVSMPILEDIEIIDTYDKNGNKINNGSSKNEGIVIDTITIKVDKNMANVLNNLKKYGEFSLTIKR